MARGQWSEVEARGVLEAWRRSGPSVERFAMWPVRSSTVTGSLLRGASEPMHMLKVSHGFDEDAFARVVALLEGA